MIAKNIIKLNSGETYQRKQSMSFTWSNIEGTQVRNQERNQEAGVERSREDWGTLLKVLLSRRNSACLPAQPRVTSQVRYYPQRARPSQAKHSSRECSAVFLPDELHGEIISVEVPSETTLVGVRLTKH